MMAFFSHQHRLQGVITAVAQPGEQPEAVAPEKADDNFADNQTQYGGKLVGMGQQNRQRLVGGSQKYSD